MAFPLLGAVVSAATGLFGAASKGASRCVEKEINQINDKTLSIIKNAKLIHDTAYGQLQKSFDRFVWQKEQHGYPAVRRFRLAIHPLKHIPRTELSANALPLLPFSAEDNINVTYVKEHKNSLSKGIADITVGAVFPISGAWNAISGIVSYVKLSSKKDIALETQHRALCEAEKIKIAASIWKDSAAKLDEAASVLHYLADDLRAASNAIEEAASLYNDDYALFPRDKQLLVMTAFNLAAGMMDIMRQQPLDESGAVPSSFIKNLARNPANETASKG